MLITEILKQNAEKYGEKPALVAVEPAMQAVGEKSPYESRRREISWRTFNEQANQTANYYIGLGIGKGNRVGILLKNSIDWLPVYFGILKSGAVAIPLNYSYSAEQIAATIRHADIDALVFGEKSSASVETALEELPQLRSLVFVGEEHLCPSFSSCMSATFAKSPQSEPVCELSAQDDAAIYFSSGTTGTPKAVVYTHGTLEAACIREQSIHHQTHSDIFVCIPPLYHVGAKLHWMGNLLMGAKGVLLLGFHLSSFFELMEKEAVTIAFLLLPWIQDILQALESGTLSLGDYDLTRWRMLHMGAQPIPPSVVDRLKKQFPALEYGISYGLTESGGPGCLNLSHEDIGKRGSIGRPVAGWSARLIDASGNPVEQGAAGELLLKGPGMMRCYYKNEAGTQAALAGGWLHTGDIAKQDAAGYYYLIDRKKDIIISGGENIYPSRLENCLRAIDGVLDAAVFGLPHERLGEVVAAVITLNPDSSLTEHDLFEHCRTFPKYEQPVKLFLGDVPRNPTGKIDKVALRKTYL